MTYVALCAGIVTLASVVLASDTVTGMKMVVAALSLLLLGALTAWRHERPELL